MWEVGTAVHPVILVELEKETVTIMMIVKMTLSVAQTIALDHLFHINQTAVSKNRYF